MILPSVFPFCEECNIEFNGKYLAVNNINNI